VHVVSPDAQTSPDLAGSGLVLQEIETLAENSLQEVVRQRVPEELRTRQIVLLGEAADEIIQISEEIKADIIVIATHGQTGWRHLVFGSVAERVVRLAHCPVLTIRAPHEQVK
jgi:nucleotide-binding universal stress UspA family protein